MPHRKDALPNMAAPKSEPAVPLATKSAGAGPKVSRSDDQLRASTKVRSFVSIGARSERGSEFLEYLTPQKIPEDLVLSVGVARTLFDVAQEYRAADTIRRHHVPLRNRLLFCGPPGCGKTVTAEVFAREVGLPMMTAKLDALVGSLLGETASNLRKMFDAVERQSVVLFLDEFDALARSRNDPNEHSEMRRVVNNLLLMIERYKGRGFVIAATNLETTLDGAILRRFDEVIEFRLPSALEIKRLFRLFTKNFPADFDVSARVGQFSGKSHADVERIFRRAIRRAVVKQRRLVSDEDMDYALEAESMRDAALQHITKGV